MHSAGDGGRQDPGLVPAEVPDSSQGRWAGQLAWHNCEPQSSHTCPSRHLCAAFQVTEGAKTLGWSLRRYLTALKDAGLGSLPGTAAEVLDDETRAIICPDKLNTAQWLEVSHSVPLPRHRLTSSLYGVNLLPLLGTRTPHVACGCAQSKCRYEFGCCCVQVIETAHEVGLPTTATIMFGHVDGPRNWARHLIAIRDLQLRTGGITEFVPLPFVHMEAPIYLKGD